MTTLFCSKHLGHLFFLLSNDNIYFVPSSVVDPNILKLVPDPGFWPNLDPDPGSDPDPGLYYQF